MLLAVAATFAITAASTPNYHFYEEGGPMILVQSKAAVARPRPGRLQNGCGIRKLAFALSLACLFAPASARAQNAYITNSGDGTVSVIDTATDTVVGSPITVGSSPIGVAVTPDGSKVYVVNSNPLGSSGTVSVIATATNTVVATIPVGLSPQGVAVTPDGSKAYVTNSNPSAFPRPPGTVSVIDTATDTVVGSPITVGTSPLGVAVTPDGRKVYVTNSNPFGSSGTVSVIDTTTNTVVGSPITVGNFPVGVAVTPDGSKVYVANRSSASPSSASVSVIATATNTVVATIPVGLSPEGVAVTPDGSKVYVTDSIIQGTVSVIDTATNTVVGSITVGTQPLGVAVTPDGSKVYVANVFSNDVSVIDTATNTVVGSPITVGRNPMAFGKFIQPAVPAVPFSAFTVRLTVYPNQSEFSINSNFTLGASSEGINPPVEPVTLQIGSFKLTIPLGSFVNAGVPGYSTFVGVIDGVSLTVLIKQASGNNYIFGVIAKNVSLPVSNPPAPIAITLTIGNDSGTTTVTPVVINTGG
jgi:YVTN family beta-propeller protein